MDPQPESTSGAQDLSSTFIKRGGTSDAGKDYEHLLIAQIILKLVTNDDVENFLLSSNDEAFGSFDDVVVEIKYRNSENIVTYAVQLKHKDNDKITTKKLAKEKVDDFSIRKYFKDYCTYDSLKKKSVKMILFTNVQCAMDDEVTNFKVKLDKQLCNVKITKSEETDKLISIKGCCFTLASNEQYDGFFKNFFLYTSQLKANSLKKNCLNMFNKMFPCKESNFNKYFDFIVDWSMIKGKKEKLNKDWMRRLILVQVLSPFVQTLSFMKKPLDPKMEILHKAVLTFQITIFHQRDSYEQLKENWENAITDVDFKQFNKTNKKYQVTTNYFEQIDETIKEDAEVNKILWLMEKCPLVIEADKPGVKETLDLLLCDEKLIILGANFDVKSLKCLQNKRDACFECLADLKSATEVYTEVMDTFVISIEGQKEAALKEVTGALQEVESDFKTDRLVKMVNDPLLGRKNEDIALPMYYVSRTLSRIVIDSKCLKKFYESSLIIVTRLTDMRRFRQWCQENGISAIYLSTKTQPTVKAIYITEQNCSQQQFDEFCGKYEELNCHQFIYINCDQLEWERSKNGVRDLEDYRLEDTLYTHESELFNDSNNNLINIICENPGMGKTTLMKSLKCATPSTCWTIFISARSCAKYLKKISR